MLAESVISMESFLFDRLPTNSILNLSLIVEKYPWDIVLSWLCNLPLLTCHIVEKLSKHIKWNKLLFSDYIWCILRGDLSQEIVAVIRSYEL